MHAVPLRSAQASGGFRRGLHGKREREKFVADGVGFDPTKDKALGGFQDRCIYRSATHPCGGASGD